MKNVQLLLSDARGVFIPRDFVGSFDLSKWQGIPEWAVQACADPESESYWEGWNEILSSAVYVADGKKFTLWQDGDLWALCIDHMTKEERDNFGFEE